MPNIELAIHVVIFSSCLSIQAQVLMLESELTVISVHSFLRMNKAFKCGADLRRIYKPKCHYLRAFSLVLRIIWCA